jgi:hypothetical protein
VRGNVVHTGQLFFPAAVTDAVYAKEPYSAHGTSPDTRNPQMRSIATAAATGCSR